MSNTSECKFDKQYKQGFAFGIYPAFADCEDLSKCAKEYNNDAFKLGFAAGRIEYENLNGPISSGLPKKILTPKLIDHFELLGKIASPLEAEGFSKHQMAVIEKAYRKALETYSEAVNFLLEDFLRKCGIEIR